MAPPSSLQTANGPTLKRSYTNNLNREYSLAVEQGRTVDGPLVQAQAPKRRHSPSCNRAVAMSSAAGPRNYENHIPSFMSVYGMDATATDSEGMGASGMRFAGSTSISKSQDNAPPCPPQSTFHSQDSEKAPAPTHSHQYRESTSTQASDSTDSSPTTTISTVDSCSLSDPSPSSSPESPITLVPLSSFASTSFSLDQFTNLKMSDSSCTIRPPVTHERPMTSPSPRRWKNPKSLALNLNSSADSLSLTSEPSSPSPSFIKPPTPQARRKPSLLSLNTGAANSNFLAPAPLGPLGNLASPGLHQRRSLKHSMSSPQIISTPSFGPKGGMTLGGERAPSRLGMASTIHEDADQEGTGVQMATRIPGVDVGGDEFDRRRFVEDDKSDGYPEGPILMHEPNVHLYSEPTLEEAMKFDVVFNVAREVKNPFIAADEAKEEVGSPYPVETPDTAWSSFSFRTAFEVQPSGYSSTPETPTTPKAKDKRPEYIHLPWDHNTNITEQLWDLCEKIEARAKEGKKVLVHCQQGASRSATLIIAYIMYCNPGLGSDKARAIAKAKSEWVNPNMSLLFCLNDFKKIVDERKLEKPVPKKPQGHRPTLSADSTLQEPPTPSRARVNSSPSAPTPVTKANQEGPVSETKTIRPKASFDFGFSSIPMIKGDTERDEGWEAEALMSPRITEMTSNPLQQGFNFSRPFAPSIYEEPPTPNLFSPRTMEFPRNIFSNQPATSASVEDPRSPPTKGEAPIIRSIDDIL
ncbi:protein-tyrosine [Phlyctema vagabunda]|uniref:protein-tyrosine-phosphatase n=1 Tax=Phlyctema vagabunda TaxID=108571 RepID=A0ABR4PS49_9HELO